MRFFATCPFGLNKVLQSELKYLGSKPNQAINTGVFFDGNFKDMTKINIGSRIANKVYLELANGDCKSFDELFDLIGSIQRDNYIDKGQNIIIKAHSKGSKLESSRTIQSISNKAIFQKLSPNQKREIDENIENVEVLVNIINDQVSILINSSGDALYKRGYRLQRGEAPIKENLAAGLILMSRWNYRDTLRDPFCGSGTFGIEAAMLAKNIAPGLNRNFAFQKWKIFDENIYLESKKEFENKIITDKKHQIYLSDISTNMLEITIINAKQAGVGEYITFKQHDFANDKIEIIGNTQIICNPPYGKRLEDRDLKKLYKKLITEIEENKKGCFISSWKETKELITKQWRYKKLYNGADESNFYFI